MLGRSCCDACLDVWVSEQLAADFGGSCCGRERMVWSRGMMLTAARGITTWGHFHHRPNLVGAKPCNPLLPHCLSHLKLWWRVWRIKGDFGPCRRGGGMLPVSLPGGPTGAVGPGCQWLCSTGAAFDVWWWRERGCGRAAGECLAWGCPISQGVAGSGLYLVSSNDLVRDLNGPPSLLFQGCERALPSPLLLPCVGCDRDVSGERLAATHGGC